MKPSVPKPAAQARTEDVLRPFEDRKWVDVGFSGDVQQRPDGLLGRRVFVLRSRPLKPTATLAVPREGRPPLGLPGRYVYMQLRVAGRGRPFALHVDVLAADRSAVRLSFATCFAAARRCGSVVQLPANALAGTAGTWVVLALDLPALLRAHAPDLPAGRCALRGFTLSGNLSFARAFTSDEVHSPLRLPPERAGEWPLALPLEPSQASHPRFAETPRDAWPAAGAVAGASCVERSDAAGGTTTTRPGYVHDTSRRCGLTGTAGCGRRASLPARRAETWRRAKTSSPRLPRPRSPPRPPPSSGGGEELRWRRAPPPAQPRSRRRPPGSTSAAPSAGLRSRGCCCGFPSRSGPACAVGTASAPWCEPSLRPP